MWSFPFRRIKCHYYQITNKPETQQGLVTSAGYPARGWDVCFARQELLLPQHTASRGNGERGVLERFSLPAWSGGALTTWPVRSSSSLGFPAVASETSESPGLVAASPDVFSPGGLLHSDGSLPGKASGISASEPLPGKTALSTPSWKVLCSCRSIRLPFRICSRFLSCKVLPFLLFAHLKKFSVLSQNSKGDS